MVAIVEVGVSVDMGLWVVDAREGTCVWYMSGDDEDAGVSVASSAILAASSMMVSLWGRAARFLVTPSLPGQ